MKKLGTNQKGFTALELLLVFVVILSLVGIGGYVWHARPKKSPVQTSSPAQVTQQKPAITPETKKLASAESSLLNYDLQYPSNWSATSQDSTQGDNGPKIRTDTISSPTGTKITITQDYGGRGGVCQPGPGDQPFKAGNTCPTSEVLSIEALKNTVYDNAGHTVPALLTFTHFAERDGKAEYNICLQASTDPKYPIEANKPVMGLVTATPFITVYNPDGSLTQKSGEPTHPFYLTACAKGTSPDFNTSADGKVVQDILRTFNFK